MRPGTHRLAGILLLAVLFLNVGDFWMTHTLVGAGLFVEANPLLAPLVGTPWFPLIKLGLVPALLLLVWMLRGRVRPQFGRSYVALIAVMAAAYTLPYVSVSLGILPAVLP